MKLNKNLIEKLKNGHRAIDNTGNPNVELLRVVLKEAFPKAFNDFTFQASVYYKSRDREDDWANLHNNLPTIPLNDFLEKEFVLPEKWCIKPRNTTEANKIFQFEEIKKHSDSRSIYYYQHCPAFKPGCTADSVINEGYTEITFEQFKEHVLKMKENKEQFPKDDFGVIVENNNGKEIIDYLVSKGFVNSLALDGDGTRKYQIGKNSLVIRYETIDTSKTYTLQQLKNLENNMENKEIIGYKLIKPEYEEVAAKICSSSATKLYGNVGAPSDILKLKTAGVLDIWFEPVYKSKEIVIRMGDKFDLTIKDGKVIHINEDITGYVHGIYMQFSTFQNNWKFGDAKSYDFQIKDVIISKSGCQNTETKLSEWILVYNESQKQK